MLTVSIVLTKTQKNIIRDCLKRKDFSAISSLSCFYQTDLNSESIIKLLKNIYFEFDEDDLNIQEKFYYILDKISDGIIKNRYLSAKKYFLYHDINDINEQVLSSFSFIRENKEDSLLGLASFLTNVMNCGEYFDWCYQNLNVLYNYYEKNRDLSYDVSTDFYNELLNKREDSYFSREKEKICRYLCEILPLSKRKEESLKTSVKLKKIDSIFKKHAYLELGTTKERVEAKLEGFASYLSSLKALRKEGIVISEAQCHKMNELFLDGKLDILAVDEILFDVPSKIIDIVYDKYTQLKLEYLSFVNVSINELPEHNLGYNYNNYKIVSQEKYIDNIMELLSNINEENALKIIELSNINPKMYLLIFFIDYFKEIEVKDVINILKNYPRIKKNNSEFSSNDAFISLFDRVLSLSNAYQNSDDVVLACLGERVTSKIVSDEGRQVVKDPNAYLNVYLRMLKKSKTFIPPVYGEYKDFYYESANNSDRERLLIGKNCNGSCIDIDLGGEEAYISALTKEDADVIIFKNKHTNEFVARSLCFRAGNYVVLAPIYGVNKIAEDLYNSELLEKIVNQMFAQAEKKKDTLRYIVLTYEVGLLDNDDYREVEDSSLKSPFPHADLDFSGYLIGNRFNDKDIRFDYKEMMLVSYNTKREKIKTKDNLTNLDFNKIRALDVMFKDYEEREILRKTFSFVDKEIYDDIYMGQDWYVAIKDGKVKDKVILPVNSELQEEEIKTIYNYLISLGYDSHELFEDLYVKTGNKR